jgi:hypothetical protein
MFDPESKNGKLMIAVCAEVCADLRAERDALRELLVKANDCLKSIHTFNTLSPEIDAAIFLYVYNAAQKQNQEGL